MRAPFAAGLLLVAAAAQAPAQSPGRPRVITGVEYYGIEFDPGASAKKMTELVIPFGIVMPVGQRLSLDLGGYYVSAEGTSPLDSVSSISGMTDLVARAAYQIKPDFAVFTLALNLPTGQTSLTQAQFDVSGVAASDLIPFPVTSFGTGFNVTSGLALAIPAGGWALGLAGSVRFNGEYTPVADTAFKPGGEYRFRLGADRLVGQGRLSFGLTYSTFSRDEIGSNAITATQPGARFIAQGSYNMPVGANNSLTMYVWDIGRAESDSTPGVQVTPAQNTLGLGLVGGFRTGRHVLRPALEYRQGWRGGESSGTLLGLSLRFTIQASPRLQVVPGARFDTGNVVSTAGTEAGFTGFSGSLSVRLGL